MKADGRGLGISPIEICCAGTLGAQDTPSVRIPKLALSGTCGICQCSVVRAWNSHWVTWCALTDDPLSVQYWEWNGEHYAPLPIDEPRHYHGYAE